MKRPFHDVPLTSHSVPQPAERRIALVIGNSRYVAEKDVLTNPSNDARDIAEALSRIGFYGVCQDGDDFVVDYGRIGVPALVDLDQRQFGRALAALARSVDGVRQAVIYYAGHGVEIAGENYLIPTDAKLQHIKDAEFETQPLSRALRTIDGAVGLKLIILDACRNNPFRARLFGTRDLSAGLRGVEPQGNVLVAYAAKHGTFASDGKNGANSPFAASLLTHIEKPGLEIVELFREVKDDVLTATSGVQEPYLYGSLGRQREYFVAPIDLGIDGKNLFEQDHSNSLGSSTSSVSTLGLAAKEWETLKSSNDIAKIRRFAEHFPGYFSELAIERINLLEEAETAERQAESERSAAEERAETERSMRALEQRDREERIAAWQRLRAVKIPSDLLRLTERDIELLGIDFDAQPLFPVGKWSSNLEEIDRAIMGTLDLPARDIQAKDVEAALGHALWWAFSVGGGSLKTIAKRQVENIAPMLSGAKRSPVLAILRKIYDLHCALLQGDAALSAAMDKLNLTDARRKELESAIKEKKSSDTGGAIAGFSLLLVALGCAAIVYWLTGAAIRNILAAWIGGIGATVVALLIAGVTVPLSLLALIFIFTRK